MLKQNSLDAYHKLNRHRVGSQIAKIYRVICESEISLCDRRITARVELPANIVESRLCQLEREGLIVQDKNAYDPVTKNVSRTWKPK